MSIRFVIFISVSIDVMDEEKCREIKDQYPVQSRHKITRINIEKKTDELSRNSSVTFAWLEKMGIPRSTALSH